jgi:hypothetical protein
LFRIIDTDGMLGRRGYTPGMAARGGPDPSRGVRLRPDLQLELTAADGSRILIRTFPEDRRLAEDLQRAAGAALRAAAGDETLLERLEDALRPWYPRLTIHPREDLASLSGEDQVWYAMRDGHIHRPEPRLDRLHAALANARDVKSDSDEAIAHARDLVATSGRRPARRPSHEPADDDAEG